MRPLRAVCVVAGCGLGEPHWRGPLTRPEAPGHLRPPFRRKPAAEQSCPESQAFIWLFLEGLGPLVPLEGTSERSQNHRKPQPDSSRIRHSRDVNRCCPGPVTGTSSGRRSDWRRPLDAEGSRSSARRRLRSEGGHARSPLPLVDGARSPVKSPHVRGATLLPTIQGSPRRGRTPARNSRANGSRTSRHRRRHSRRDRAFQEEGGRSTKNFMGPPCGKPQRLPTGAHWADWTADWTRGGSARARSPQRLPANLLCAGRAPGPTGRVRTHCMPPAPTPGCLTPKDASPQPGQQQSPAPSGVVPQNPDRRVSNPWGSDTRNASPPVTAQRSRGTREKRGRCV